jgi:hypothetical protein
MQLALEVGKRNANILRDWFGRDCASRLVSLGEQIWFVKCKDEAEKKRDLLASQLAAGWLNVAEARNLSRAEFARLQQLELPTPSNLAGTYLVRFALDYDLDGLPIRDPDIAIAHELVFSLWVRRRDAHAFNRVYKRGIPIFFDFGTAFLGERRLVDLRTFFRRGPNPGWPGWWRVWQCSQYCSDTLLLRRMENEGFQAGRPKVFVPVCNQQVFLAGLIQCEHKIARLTNNNILEAIEMAGFYSPEKENIHSFLIDSQRELPTSIEVLRNIVLAP